MFGLKYRGEYTGGDTGAEFEHLTASISAFAEKEHNGDGTHGDITAASLTLQGARAGEIVSLAYDSGRYVTLDAAVWTVTAANQQYLRASRIGQLVFVQFALEQTTITVDTPSSLYIRLPEMHALPARDIYGSPSYQVGGLLFWYDNQHFTSGMGQVSAQAQDFANTVPSTLLQLDLVKDGTSDASMYHVWPFTNDLRIQGSCWFAVEPNNEAVPFYGA